MSDELETDFSKWTDEELLRELNHPAHAQGSLSEWVLRVALARILERDSVTKVNGCSTCGCTYDTIMRQKRIREKA